jgi:phosphoenolpyruvate-protein phosphotransferase (PTS system enzyme I)
MASSSLKGQCASPGFAAGVVAVLARSRAALKHQGSPDTAASALRLAIHQAIAEINDMAEKASGEAADMLAFQVAMLEDEALSEPAFTAIAAGVAADRAWSEAMAAEIDGYEASDDAYFRARASDLVDMRERVLDVLSGATAADLKPGSIIFADDITPTRFLSAEWAGGAILLRRGSATSHVAMLARSQGVPMIVGLAANDIAGRPVLIDAGGGMVIVDPTPAEQNAFRRSRAASETRAAEAAAYLGGPALTADGIRIETLINVADPGELDRFDPASCDGIGLVRTELLFEGKSLPSEDGQFAVYSRIMRWATAMDRDLPVTFRTLDAGGDKPIPGLTPEGESNPFLGVRGVRLTLRRKDVFLPQLRALARAAALGDLEVMIPMVSTPHELEASRALLHEACGGLAREGIAHRMPRLGMMVEVPAAALTLERFDAAFFSIGSNDLTQYVMAAGRDIAEVAALADPADPAVLKLLAMVAEHGRRTGAKVSLCGDAGGDERLIPLLLEQGIRVLSMSPRLLAGAKRTIAGLTLGGHSG